QQKASAVVRKTALDIEADAKERAPVDTGVLRNSIQATPAGPLRWIIGEGAEYAAFVEFGTSRAPAQPHLLPAVEAARPGFQAAMSKIAG
ncbi:MAG TPA: HK97 gp10 family phage protein, partial [Acidobacteriota bacterium]|nr:HK97 gp10 family phage protein [Acidobacteriota bacterium]